MDAASTYDPLSANDPYSFRVHEASTNFSFAGLGRTDGRLARRGAPIISAKPRFRGNDGNPLSLPPSLPLRASAISGRRSMENDRGKIEPRSPRIGRTLTCRDAAPLEALRRLAVSSAPIVNFICAPSCRIRRRPPPSRSHRCDRHLFTTDYGTSAALTPKSSLEKSITAAVATVIPFSHLLAASSSGRSARRVMPRDSCESPLPSAAAKQQHRFTSRSRVYS